MVNSSVRRLLAILLLAASPALAQEQGGELPSLEVENITIIGTRTIKLPPARKGEVIDSSVYVLAAGDTLLFGERLSNFGGPGGALPGYREFEPPMSAHAEASFGTYLSPRAMLHGEYTKRSFDVMGTVDYRATAGHADSTGASSLLFDVRGGVLLGGDDPTAPRVRIGAGVDRIGDDYFLYGNRLTPFDRDRAAMRVNARLESAQDALLDYDLYFNLEHTSVGDALGDSTQSTSASIPRFGLGVAAGNDTLRGRLSIDYQIASLQYGASARTPNWVAANAEVEYQLTPRFFLTGGVVYSGAQRSDTGSTTLLMPRVAARLVSPSLSLYAWFAPELRAPSYRNRLMRAPYVDARMELDPERVLVSAVVGARFGSTAPIDGPFGSTTTLDGRVVFEMAEHTPVVVADSTPGVLRYAHVESRTLALRANLQMQPMTSLGLLVDAEVRSAVDVDTDEQLPMTPQIEARLRGDYRLSEVIGLSASGRFESAQRVGLDAAARELGARFLLDAGVTFQFSPAIALVGEVTNLLNTGYELWDGYVAPGLEARAGARVTF